MNGNRPLFTFLTFAVMFIVDAVLLIFVPDADHNTEVILIIGLTTASVPGLVSSFFAERSSRDIRNGVVIDKARQGAEKALNASDVPDNTQKTHDAVAALSTLLNDRMNAPDAEGNLPLGAQKADT